MDNEWDQYAADWDGDPAARAYAQAVAGSLTDLLGRPGPSLDGTSVLDFGCGTGLLTEHLVAAGANVTAVDTSTAMLDVVDTKIAQRGWTTVDTSTEVPDRAARFDLIVCSSVCAFLDDYPTTVAELVGHLVPGGIFAQWDWERTDEDDHGLTRAEIGHALTAAGLAEVVVETAFAIEADGHTMAPLVGHGRRPSSGPGAGPADG